MNGNNSTAWVLRNSTATIVSSVALVVVIVLALAGNVIVCLAFYRASNLRSLTVIFILSLAVTDILVASISIPIWLSFQLSGCFSGFRVQCDPTLYTAWKCLDVLFSTASIMNLCAISIDRLIAITMPLRYHELMTPKRATIGLVAIWIFALLLSGAVSSKWPSFPIFVFIVAFIAPLSVMVYSYSRIFKAALLQARRVYPIRQAYYFKKELKAAKTLAIVMGAFIVCWAPFFFLNLIALYRSDLIPTATAASGIKFLHYVNSALNPVIYPCTNREFRFKILRVLPCKCGGRRDHSMMERVVFWTTSFSPGNGFGNASFRREATKAVIHNREDYSNAVFRQQDAFQDQNSASKSAK